MYDFTGEVCESQSVFGGRLIRKALYTVERPGGSRHFRWVDVDLLKPHELTALKYAQHRADEALLNALHAV